MTYPIEPIINLSGRVAARVRKFENNIVEGEEIQPTDSDDHQIIVNFGNHDEPLTQTIELSPSTPSLSIRNSADVVPEINIDESNSQIIGQEEEGLSESPRTSEAPSRRGEMILVGSAIALTGMYIGGMYANLNSEFVRKHYIELIASHTITILSIGCLGYLKLSRRESRDNDEHQTSSESPTTVFAELVHVHPNALPAGTNNSENNSTETLRPVMVENLFAPPKSANLKTQN
jgi:hypothetical protein